MLAKIAADVKLLAQTGLVATLLTAMTQEHERAAGAWHTRSGSARRRGSTADFQEFITRVAWG